MRIVKWIGCFLYCCCTLVSYAQKKQVSIGNQLYQQKKYKDAANAYQQALTKNPGFTPGLFNLGNTFYQQKNYDASRKVLAATAKQASDKNVKADANYNIGNSYLSEQKWEDAINSYKAALRNNPQDEAAKYNLSYAQAMMKKNQSGGGGKNNKQDKNQNKDQNKDSKDQKKDQENKQDQKDDQNKDQQQNKEDQKDKQDQRPQPQPSKLSREQADQLLNALAQEEKKLHDKKEKGKAIKVKVDKDW